VKEKDGKIILQVSTFSGIVSAINVHINTICT
jgi:hypothetical protein